MKKVFTSFEVEETGHRFYTNGRKFLPSVTTILSATLPPSDHLQNFWRENGWVGQQVFRRLGELGTKVHEHIDYLEAGGQINSSGLSLKEKKCLMGFLNWHQEVSPKLISGEQVVVSSRYRYAGRYDRLYEIDGETWLIDWKTGSRKDADKYQQGAYWHCLKEEFPEIRCGLLYLGTTAKQGFSFTETAPKKDFKTFLLLRKTFDSLFPDPLSKMKTYPEIFSL